jgi:hypothetical protein
MLLVSKVGSPLQQLCEHNLQQLQQLLLINQWFLQSQLWYTKGSWIIKPSLIWRFLGMESSP